jgi:hypothetical protein
MHKANIEINFLYNSESNDSVVSLVKQEGNMVKYFRYYCNHYY